MGRHGEIGTEESLKASVRSTSTRKASGSTWLGLALGLGLGLGLWLGLDSGQHRR